MAAEPDSTVRKGPAPNLVNRDAEYSVRSADFTQP
jgi:hypothetical protein